MSTCEYGAIELAYAAPIAGAIASNPTFSPWLLARTKFGNEAATAKPLVREMQERRGKSATWWRSHYTERCRCRGCSGQETDLLAIFESANDRRFALHIELKQPMDEFSTKRDQAEAYAVGAACWAGSAPRAIIPHQDADTMLICDSTGLHDFKEPAAKFGSVVTFQSIRDAFPVIRFPL